MKKSVVLVMALVITVGMSGIVSAKSWYWFFTGTKTIESGKVVQTPNVTIDAGSQTARLHSQICNRPGKVYVSRVTKGWFFWSTQETVGANFTGDNQYRYFDLGIEKSSKNTYYTITNFKDSLDKGSNVSVRINDAYVVIE